MSGESHLLIEGNVLEGEKKKSVRQKETKIATRREEIALGENDSRCPGLGERKENWGRMGMSRLAARAKRKAGALR